MTITTSITSPPGTYQIMISATSPGGTTKTQLLILSVNFVPDYILAITNPSLTAHVEPACHIRRNPDLSERLQQRGRAQLRKRSSAECGESADCHAVRHWHSF